LVQFTQVRFKQNFKQKLTTFAKLIQIESKVVCNEFDLIKRLLQLKTWFHPLLHFSLVMLGILLSTLLEFFSG